MIALYCNNKSESIPEQITATYYFHIKLLGKVQTTPKKTFRTVFLFGTTYSFLSVCRCIIFQPRNLNHDLVVPYTRKDKGDETEDINL